MRLITLFSTFALFTAIAFKAHANDRIQDLQITSSDPELTLGASYVRASNSSAENNFAVVLLSVAGPVDRDMTLGTHKYFKELALGLAERGISSLRYDDRGVGESAGNLLTTSLETRAQDACKAAQVLQTRFGHKAENIGFIGLSEGSGIALLASQQCFVSSYNVLLSAPLRAGKIEMQEQMQRLLAFSAFSEEQKQAIKEKSKEFLALVSAQKPDDNRQKILALMKSQYGNTVLPPYGFVPTEPEAKTDFVLSPWYQSQINYAIDDALFANKAPTLVVYGGKDTVLNIEQNQKIASSQPPNYKVVYIKSLNHLMQTANTGSPAEYASLPMGMSTSVIAGIAEWIKAH